MKKNDDPSFIGINISDTLLVGVDFANGPDEGIMMIGRKKPNQSVEVINMFTGKEARDLYKKLVTVVPKMGEGK